jgi:hypothetical protein
MKNVNVTRYAIKDINNYMREQGTQIKDEYGDIWVVTGSKIDCPEQRKLNKELGVTKVNYTKEAMRRKR